MPQNQPSYEKTDASEKENITDSGVTEETEERDDYAEFTAAVKGVTRVRYRVKREDNPYTAALFVIMGIILVCAVFIGVGNNDTSTIVFAAVIIAAVITGVAVFIVSKVKARTPYYCYYARTEDGVFCMSVIGDTATVFAHGRAYRIEGERFYILDEKGYREWLDGEGVGLYTALCSDKKDFECSCGAYAVASPHGGSHEFFIRGGVIEKIKSVQPISTEDVDQKTGEAKLKYRTFTKTEPTTDFKWEVPEFVTDAFSAADESLPDMTLL